MYSFKVNGKQIKTNQNVSLLRYLRDELKIMSVKNGCSEGACGTCMVLVDEKPIKACIVKTSKLQEKEVETVEGFTKYEKEVYSYAFAKSGAVQCGYCIPGMLISAKGLLYKTKHPSYEEVKDSIKNNICRCTGYKKIIQAIMLVVDIMNGKEDMENDINAKVGEAFFRIDAQKKALGLAKYTDDIDMDDMLYGGAVRSKYPRAIVKDIDTKEAQKLEGVVAVVTAKDIKGSKKIGHLKKDWDVLIEKGETTHYVGDAIVLIVAKTREDLQKAKSLVKIEYDVKTPIIDPVKALDDDSDLVHPKSSKTNCMFEQKLTRGNAEKAIQNSKYVVTKEYDLPPTEHAFLETETAVACYENDILTIYSSDQGIYQTRQECADMLGISPDRVRVKGMYVGGGFGGKEDMSVQHHASLLAYITKSPVKVALSRRESIITHPKRHAMKLKFTLACDEKGILTGLKARIIADTGAYASLGGPVLQRACTHAAGPYNYQNIDIIGKAVYTNNPPAGAFRGFGVTQSCFALESNLDLLAEKVNISPWEIRYKNAIRKGQELPNGQIADKSTALVETLEAVKEEYQKNKYVGIACAMKNSGLGVGVPDTGRCNLKVKNGKVNILSSAACIGQGLGTVLIQIVCTQTGLSEKDVKYSMPDTKYTPNSGNTTASRQTVFTGEAARTASLKLKEALKTKSLKECEGMEFKGEFSFATDSIGSDIKNPVSHIAYGFATQLVVLDDDGKIKKVVAAHDVGKAINPVSLEGQIEGGVVMSLGYSLTEKFPLKDGIPTARFANLGLLRSKDVPEIESILIEKSKKDIAYGAKGVGEICSIPTPPAVMLAYYRYDNKFRTKLPLLDTPYNKAK